MPRSLWLLVIGMIINVTGASYLWSLNIMVGTVPDFVLGLFPYFSRKHFDTMIR